MLVYLAQLASTLPKGRQEPCPVVGRLEPCLVPGPPHLARQPPGLLVALGQEDTDTHLRLDGELLELPGGAPLRVAVALGTGLLVVVTALISLCLTTAGRVRRDLRREGGESYVQRVEIDGFGVRVTARGRQARVGFDKLMRVEETGKAIYLYLSANRAWILPKDQMEDPRGECARLRALFSTVIESRRLKLKKA